MSELEHFDIGDILDVAMEFVGEQNDTRAATQEDFDRFQKSEGYSSRFLQKKKVKKWVKK